MKEEVAVGNDSAALEDAVAELEIGEIEVITKLEGKDDPLNWSPVARCEHWLSPEREAPPGILIHHIIRGLYNHRCWNVRHCRVFRKRVYACYLIDCQGPSCL